MSFFSWLGVILVVVGVSFIFCGARKTQTLTNRVIELATGHYTKKTNCIFFAGIIVVLVGAIIIYLGWEPVSATHG